LWVLNTNSRAIALYNMVGFQPDGGVNPGLPSTRPLQPATLAVPLLTPIDQWGYVPFPPQRLSPHSLSRRVRDLLAGDLGAHRDLPVDGEDTDTPTPTPVPVVKPLGVQQAGRARGLGPGAAPTSRT
jgi:hypothetical protein